jgi:recombination protein RecA
MNQKVLDLKKSLLKNYKNSIVLAGNEAEKPTEFLRLPSLKLQRELGVPGLPLGRYIEIAGWEGSGKSTFAIQIIAENQDRFPDRIALYADYEGTMDREYMEMLGVDPSRVLLIQPSTLEEGGNMIRSAVESGEIYMCIVDSVDAMVPELQDDKEEGGSSQKGTKARALGDHIRKNRSRFQRNNCAAIYLNQMRENPGAYGNPEYSTGGNALPFYCTMRFFFRAKARVEGVGHTLSVKVPKNKLFREINKAIELDFVFQEGINKMAETREFAKELNVLTGGNKLTYMGEHEEFAQMDIGNSKAEHIAFLRDNPEFYNVLREEVVSLLEGSE